MKASMAWCGQFIPTEQFCAKGTVDLAANLAVCCFNNGAQSLVAVLDAMGCSGGAFMEAAMTREDMVRVRKSDTKCTRKEKKARKKRKRKSKGYEEKAVEKEGVTYQSGGFSTVQGTLCSST